MSDTSRTTRFPFFTYPWFQLPGSNVNPNSGGTSLRGYSFQSSGPSNSARPVIAISSRSRTYWPVSSESRKTTQSRRPGAPASAPNHFRRISGRTFSSSPAANVITVTAIRANLATYRAPSISISMLPFGKLGIVTRFGSQIIGRPLACPSLQRITCPVCPPDVQERYSASRHSQSSRASEARLSGWLRAIPSLLENMLSV